MNLQRNWPILPHNIDIPDLLKNGNWKTHTTSYDLRNDIPEKSGMYIFHAIPSGLRKSEGIFATMQTILYVGIAKENGSLRSRYRRHYRRPKFKQCQQTYMRNFKYSYIVLDDIDDIKKLRSYEQLIINLFGPPLNDRNEIEEETLDRSFIKS
jgi:hypothetical protein